MNRRKSPRPTIGIVLVTMVALVLAGCSDTRGQAMIRDGEGPASPPLRAPDVRYEPSPHGVVRAMLELAKVTDQDLVYDLGSGDGRVPIAAALDFGARAVGIDIDPKLIARSKENAREAGVSSRVTFRNEDLFTTDFSDATVVTLFLYPDVNMKLRPKLLRTLRPGTRVVSHWHSMEDWQPTERIQVEGRPVYLWVIPDAQR